jgi:hypothetical protein
MKLHAPGIAYGIAAAFAPIAVGWPAIVAGLAKIYCIEFCTLRRGVLFQHHQQIIAQGACFDLFRVSAGAAPRRLPPGAQGGCPVAMVTGNWQLERLLDRLFLIVRLVRTVPAVDARDVHGNITWNTERA